MIVHWFELRRWWAATAPARKPSGYSEEDWPQPHLHEVRRVKCGRRRKWRSGSESMDHCKIASRAKGGITLIGVVCSVSRVVDEESPRQSTWDMRRRRKERVSACSICKTWDLKVRVTRRESLYGGRLSERKGWSWWEKGSLLKLSAAVVSARIE